MAEAVEFLKLTGAEKSGQVKESKGSKAKQQTQGVQKPHELGNALATGNVSGKQVKGDNLQGALTGANRENATNPADNKAIAGGNGFYCEDLGIQFKTGNGKSDDSGVVVNGANNYSVAQAMANFNNTLVQETDAGRRAFNAQHSASQGSSGGAGGAESSGFLKEFCSKALDFGFSVLKGGSSSGISNNSANSVEPACRIDSSDSEPVRAAKEKANQANTKLASEKSKLTQLQAKKTDIDAKVNAKQAEVQKLGEQKGRQDEAKAMQECNQKQQAMNTANAALSKAQQQEKTYNSQKNQYTNEQKDFSEKATAAGEKSAELGAQSKEHAAKGAALKSEAGALQGQAASLRAKAAGEQDETKKANLERQAQSLENEAAKKLQEATNEENKAKELQAQSNAKLNEQREYSAQAKVAESKLNDVEVQISGLNIDQLKTAAENAKTEYEKAKEAADKKVENDPEAKQLQEELTALTTEQGQITQEVETQQAVVDGLKAEVDAAKAEADAATNVYTNEPKAEEDPEKIELDGRQTLPDGSVITKNPTGDGYTTSDGFPCDENGVLKGSDAKATQALVAQRAGVKLEDIEINSDDAHTYIAKGGDKIYDELGGEYENYDAYTKAKSGSDNTLKLRDDTTVPAGLTAKSNGVAVDPRTDTEYHYDNDKKRWITEDGKEPEETDTTEE